MSLKFSVVIPTRHRPEFIAESLKYIALQNCTNFEVVISDNYTNPDFSCETVIKKAGLQNVIYVRPNKPVGMVENWNFALKQTKGDYVLFLTDKMFLLPDTLWKLNATLSEVQADIVSWIDDSFNPLNYEDYFGGGEYVPGVSTIGHGLNYERFDPLVELNLKGSGAINRSEQSKSTYSRGKICFGAYSKELIKTVKDKYGSLFFNITPDYTSMILALSEAKVCIEMASAGIVHLNTDLSNGRLASANDSLAKAYLDSLDSAEEIYSGMLVKGLYSSVNNMLTHDYGVLKNKYHLPFDFNHLNWLSYIYEDIFNPEKVWSSDEVEEQHKSLYTDYVRTLASTDQEYLQVKISARTGMREENLIKIAEKALEAEQNTNRFKRFLKLLIPTQILGFYHFIRQLKTRKIVPPNQYPSLYDAVTNKK